MGSRLASRSQAVLRVLLSWTALVSGVLVWLPLVRGVTQGSIYRWAFAPGIGGRGVGGDYWLLLVAAVFVGVLLYTGWRGARRPFHWLLLLFQVPLAGAVAYAVWRNPEDLRFEGATLGIDVSLAIAGPLLFGGFAALAVLWVVQDLRSGRVATLVPWVWTRATRVRAVLIAVLFPLEALLFRSGGIQSGANVVGVTLVFWQWVMINRALASARSEPG
jgi:hypothetical protein